MVALITAGAHDQFLAQELPYATGTAKAKQNQKNIGALGSGKPAGGKPKAEGKLRLVN